MSEVFMKIRNITLSVQNFIDQPVCDRFFRCKISVSIGIVKDCFIRLTGMFCHNLIQFFFSLRISFAWISISEA